MALSEIYRHVFDTLRGRWLTSYCVLFVWALAYCGVALIGEQLHWLASLAVVWAMAGVVFYSASNMFLRLSRDSEGASVFSVAWLGFGAAWRSTRLGFILMLLYFIYVAVLTLIVYVLFVPILIKPILMLSLILIFSMVAGGWLWTSFVLAPYYLHDRPDLGALNAVRQAYVDVRGYRLQLLKCDLPVMLAMVVLSVLPLMWMKGSSDGMERASAPEDMAVQAEAFEYGRRVSYDELRAMDVQGMQKDQFVREMLAFRQQEEALPSDVAYDEKAGHWEAILQQIEGSGMSQRSLRMLVVYAIFMFLVNILGMMLILAVHAEFYRHLSMDREAPGGEETGGGRLGGAGGGGGGFEPGGPRRCMSVDLDRHASLDLDGQINADGRQIDNSLGLEDMSDFMPEVKSLPDDHGIHDALASISEIKSLPDEHRINDALASMSEVKSLPDEHGISALASMLEAGLLSPEPVRKHGSVREGTDPGFRINF